MLLMKEIPYYPGYPQNPTENGSIIFPTGSLNNMVSIMLVKAHVWANLSNVSRFFKNQATYPRAPSADSGIATKLMALQCSWASDKNMRGFVNNSSRTSQKMAPQFQVQVANNLDWHSCLMSPASSPKVIIKNTEAPDRVSK